jgi:hypothetical protein
MREYDVNFPRLSFGPHRQRCLKVLNTFWATRISKSFWREGTVLSFDSRYIRRLARAYGLARLENDGRASMVEDQCNDFAWGLSSLTDRIEYVSFTSLLSSHAFRTAAGLTLAGGCYGGLQLTAWACQFPSNAETVLWRAASVTILATGPTIIVFALHMGAVDGASFGIVDPWLERHHFGWPHWIRRTLNRIETVEEYARYALFFLWAVWYLLCRTFIVVECFIMLAHLPDTTLEIPTWAAYIPHIV